MLSAYQQKEKDIESILDMQKQNSKQRHDIKNVLVLIRELINDNSMPKQQKCLINTVQDRRMLILQRL